MHKVLIMRKKIIFFKGVESVSRIAYAEKKKIEPSASDIAIAAPIAPHCKINSGSNGSVTTAAIAETLK